jgi:hypothetical protein
MKHPPRSGEAQPTDKISVPLQQPEEWKFSAGGSTVSVMDRTWFGARKQAAALLGVTNEDCECVLNPVTDPIGVAEARAEKAERELRELREKLAVEKVGEFDVFKNLEPKEPEE